MLEGLPGRGRRFAAAVALVAGLCPGASLAQERQWRALPVAGGTNAIAAAAGIEPGLPAWRVLYEATRRRHGLWGEAAGGGTGRGAGGPGGAAAVPLPLAPSTWRGLLRRDDLPEDQLGGAIVADRRSALLYRALASFDEPTLAALAADADAVRRFVRPSRGRAGCLRRALPRAGGRGGGAGRRGGGAVVGQAGGREPPLGDGVPAGPARGERGPPGSAVRFGGPPRPAAPALRARAVPPGRARARGRPALPGRGLRP